LIEKIEKRIKSLAPAAHSYCACRVSLWGVSERCLSSVFFLFTIVGAACVGSCRRRRRWWWWRRIRGEI